MWTKEFKDSFGVKVFRILALSILLIAVVLTLFLVYYGEKSAEEDLIRQGKLLVRLMARNSRTGVFAENSELLKDTVQGILEQESVTGVSLYTFDDKILLDEEKGTPGKGRSRERQTISQIMASGGDSYDVRVLKGQNTLEFLTPVVLETFANFEEALYFDDKGGEMKTRVIGYARLSMDKTILRRESESIAVRSTAIALAFLLVGAVFIYFMIKRAVRPLTSLTEAVKLLGEGKFAGKVPVETLDEVGKLAMAFNAMADSLRRRNEENMVLEEKLRHAQKMEAVGTLARGIAHDFNNILSTVQGSVYIVDKKLYEDSPLKVYTAQMSNSLGKAKKLIDSLLTFSKTYAPNLVPVDIEKLIVKARPMLTSVVGEGIDLRWNLSDVQMTVMADFLQIEQVLLNLCTNARDAMPGGGILTIETKKIGKGLQEPSQGESKPGSYCLVSVRDTGTGMDRATLERIFEPFFTTKEVGRGTGLGLSIVYGIIEQHKGIIEVDSREGGGTEIRILLPLQQDGA